MEDKLTRRWILDCHACGRFVRCNDRPEPKCDECGAGPEMGESLGVLVYENRYQ